MKLSGTFWPERAIIAVATRAHTIWILIAASIAVVVGWATLNMMLADNAIAVLYHHATPLLAQVSRLNRQL